MAMAGRMLFLDSMRRDLYVFSHSIYVSLLTALCLYNLLSHTQDLSDSANAETPNTLSRPLVAPMCEDP